MIKMNPMWRKRYWPSHWMSSQVNPRKPAHLMGIWFYVCVCIYMYLLLPRCLCLSFERIERNGICYLWVEIVEELLRNCKNTLKRGEESYYKYFLEIRNSILFYFNFFSLSFCMLLKIASCGWCLFFWSGWCLKSRTFLKLPFVSIIPI